MQYVCDFSFGLRQSSNTDEWLNFVTTINGGTIVINAEDEELEAGDYELILEMFDLNDPALLTRYVHTITVTVKAVNADCGITQLPMIILEPGQSSYEKWRVLLGVSSSDL